MDAVRFVQVTPEQMANIVSDAVALGVCQAFKTMKTAPEVMDEREAADYLRLSANTLRNYRSEKRGPQYCKSGSKIVYRLRDLEHWLESHRVLTADPKRY